MKMTIRLDKNLHKEAKELAARTGRSLTAVVEDALSETLARPSLAGDCPSVRLPTFAGKGMQPSVNLDDSAD
ncbi:MAG: hypothetical protein BZY88_13330 [SAR202 cluster bacterium Io17-Chloro-G9]|nr:MAG: hypothetical protein BZY88_13330 [SAR202 cluster bacterium Io17-Chloro-G9]